MLAQLKAAARKPADHARTDAVAGGAGPSAVATDKRVDFAAALKASLDQVNQSQTRAETLGRNFVLGDDRVSLSDVMIAEQKANISFQATVQVRNKLVSAYQDIMNMPV